MQRARYSKYPAPCKFTPIVEVFLLLNRWFDWCLLCCLFLQATIAQGHDAGPHKITDTLAFMFESCLIPRICLWAVESPSVDHEYYQCWIGLKSHFSQDVNSSCV